MRDGAISSTYGNGPTTVLDHFRVKFWFLAHDKKTRLQQGGSLPEPVLACFRQQWPNSKSVVACFGFGAHIGACQNHITDPVSVARFTAEQSPWLRAARSPALNARFAERRWRVGTPLGSQPTNFSLVRSGPAKIKRPRRSSRPGPLPASGCKGLGMDRRQLRIASVEQFHSKISDSHGVLICLGRRKLTLLSRHSRPT